MPREDEKAGQTPLREPAHGVAGSGGEHSLIDQRDIDRMAGEESQSRVERRELAGDTHVLLAVNHDTPAEPLKLAGNDNSNADRFQRRCMLARTGNLRG